MLVRITVRGVFPFMGCVSHKLLLPPVWSVSRPGKYLPSGITQTQTYQLLRSPTPMSVEAPFHGKTGHTSLWVAGPVHHIVFLFHRLSKGLNAVLFQISLGKTQGIRQQSFVFYQQYFHEQTSIIFDFDCIIHHNSESNLKLFTIFFPISIKTAAIKRWRR